MLGTVARTKRTGVNLLRGPYMAQRSAMALVAREIRVSDALISICLTETGPSGAAVRRVPGAPPFLAMTRVALADQ